MSNVARVTATHRERYSIVCREGEGFARLKGSRFYGESEVSYPTTGDFVTIQYNPLGDSLITEVLPRHSKFARNDFSGHAVGYVKTVLEQVVAANFDYVFILSSLNQELNRNRLARYLTLAHDSGGRPAVVLTKADLVADPAPIVEKMALDAPGVPVFAISARTGAGLTALHDFLQPRKTLVFLGSSGVGKSSLVNALAGEELMRVNEIREDDSRGRHTTTHRQLLRLNSGVLIIDTPGMRELGMWDVGEGLGAAFTDVEALLGQCRFSDCRHNGEPGCAIREALASGALDPKRWANYQALRGETRFVAGKALTTRQKARRR